MADLFAVGGKLAADWRAAGEFLLHVGEASLRSKQSGGGGGLDTAVGGGRAGGTQHTHTLTDSLSEAEELRARAGPLLSDWLVRVERRVDWKLLLLKRSLPETQSSAPR